MDSSWQTRQRIQMENGITEREVVFMRFMKTVCPCDFQEQKGQKRKPRISDSNKQQPDHFLRLLYKHGVSFHQSAVILAKFILRKTNSTTFALKNQPMGWVTRRPLWRGDWS